MTDKLIILFSEILNVDGAILNEESSPDTIDEWDSLGAMSLVAAIEDQFAVQLSTKDIMKMDTIGLARQLLQDKGVKI